MNSRYIACAVLLFGVAALLRAAETNNFTLPPEKARLKPGPGEELATGQCLLCHSADYIANQPRLTRQAWKAEVTKMKLKYGAPIETNNIDLLADYLVKNYGKPAPDEPSKK
ncbi:MAG: Sulfite:cytochrome c oxidoreductase subunit precursor [Pedosphaera sp.]|nr:Sulfite:cytochrome c oxidoreductase subunit precursor [Pedosphaera sp.]